MLVWKQQEAHLHQHGRIQKMWTATVLLPAARLLTMINLATKEMSHIGRKHQLYLDSNVSFSSNQDKCN